MSKKPPELPNIEDATLRACLAPLVDAMNNGAEAAAPVAHPAVSSGVPAGRPVDPPRLPAGSNDNPVPPAGPIEAREPENSAIPKTLAEWRSLADDEFGAFRMTELFLSMTEAELETAAAEFPKQIGATVARISGIKRRLAARYDAVTTVTALLQRAMERVDARDGTDPRVPEIASTRDRSII